MKKYIVIIALGAIALMFGKYTIPTFGNTSEGERVGTIQKMTNRGMIAKTYEGEMAMDGIKSTNSENGSNSISSVFEFSVKDKALFDTINAHLGQKVKVYYKQYWHVNAYDGDANYIVSKIEVIK